MHNVALALIGSSVLAIVVGFALPLLEVLASVQNRKICLRCTARAETHAAVCSNCGESFA